MQELGKEHSVKAFNFKRQYPDILFPGKTQYVTKDDNAVPVESEALLDTANPFTYISTAKAIRRFNPDLLIMRYWMSWFAPSLGYVARHVGRNCKIISILDNVIPHEPHFFDRLFTKWFLKPNYGFVVLCDAVRNDLLSFDREKPVLVTPHPLYSHFGAKISKEQACRQLGIKPNKRNILFFGLIREYKGLDLLIEAFNLLDDSYQLIIAGEPYGSFDKYEALIDSSPYRDNISVTTNYIKDSCVSPYFSASDVCVLPYRSATQSGISSICFNFNLPMITTDVGGLKETIGDKGTGMIIKDCRKETIADAIKSYFDNRSLREEYVKNIERVKDELSWKTFCNRLVEFYKKDLSGSR